VIDQHTCDHQDTLMMERKLNTHDWATRVILSIFAIILVDCWQVYSKRNKLEVQKDFYENLASEMTDNCFDRVAPALVRSLSLIDDDKEADMYYGTTGAPKCGISAQLTPTIRKRKTREG
jgi:lantibiotic modifying enzyme